MQADSRSPGSVVAPTVVPLIDAGRLRIDLRIGPFVVRGGGHGGRDRRARCGLRKRGRGQRDGFSGGPNRGRHRKRDGESERERSGPRGPSIW